MKVTPSFFVRLFKYERSDMVAPSYSVLTYEKSGPYPVPSLYNNQSKIEGVTLNLGPLLPLSFGCSNKERTV